MEVDDNVVVIGVDVGVVENSTFHPTTAIAPTVELDSMVVVAIDQEVESP